MTTSYEQQAITEPSTDNATWVSDYIFWSFYFSQGSPDVQKYYDQYAVNNFSEKFTNLFDIRKGICEEVDTRVRRFIGASTNHIDITNNSEYNEGTIGFQVAARFESLSDENRKIAKKTSIDGEAVQDAWMLELMLTKMIKVEKKHLGFEFDSRDKAMGNKTDEGTRTLDSSPRFGRSIILGHLVDGKVAKHEVFVKLFRELRSIDALIEQGYFNYELSLLANREAELRGTPPRNIGAFLLGLKSQSVK